MGFPHTIGAGMTFRAEQSQHIRSRLNKAKLAAKERARRRRKRKEAQEFELERVRQAEYAEGHRLGFRKGYEEASAIVLDHAGSLFAAKLDTEAKVVRSLSDKLSGKFPQVAAAKGHVTTGEQRRG